MKHTLFTLLIVVTATTATAGQPYLPTDAERARWTLSDMMTLKTAIEAYRLDHNAAPEAKSIDELRAAVEPMYVAHLPMTDAWGHPFAYERVGDDYRIVSAGSDGAFDRASWSTAGKQTDLATDAVLNGTERWWFRSWTFSR